jgi:hypothetical protein
MAEFNIHLDDGAGAELDPALFNTRREVVGLANDQDC